MFCSIAVGATVETGDEAPSSDCGSLYIPSGSVCLLGSMVRCHTADCDLWSIWLPWPVSATTVTGVSASYSSGVGVEPSVGS